MKMKGMARSGLVLARLIVVIAILCCSISVVAAQPQSPFVFYGTATLNDRVLTAEDNDVVISLEVYGLGEVARYRMGDIPVDYYMLEVHDVPVGGYAIIYINVIPAANVEIGAPGDPPQRLDISATQVLTSIAISPQSVTLYVGEQQQFTATAYDQVDNVMEGVTFNWTVGDDTIGTINANGLFTALAVGTTTITAVSGGVSATADVTVASVPLTIDKEADRTTATVGDVITFWFNVTNTGNITLLVKISDVFENKSTTLDPWFDFNVYLLPNDTHHSDPFFTYTVKSTDIGAPITNTLFAVATPYDLNGNPCGENFSMNSSVTVNTYNASLNITKEANRTEAAVGDVIKYWVNVTNTGNINLFNVVVTDTKLGLSDIIAILAPNQTKSYERMYTVKPGDIGEPIKNTAFANVTDPCERQLSEKASASVKTYSKEPLITLTKTGSPTVVTPGGTVTYTITYSNTGGDAHDVVITESYPQGVTFMSASPAPDPGTNNRWTIGTLPTGASKKIVITVKVPEAREFSFTERGGVSGEGLVMVSKELSTEQASYSLRNAVTLTCAELDPMRASADITVSGVLGTKTSLFEHGSGMYSSEQSINVDTENRSIYFGKSTEAEYKPTSFDFGDFLVNFTTKWNQNLCSTNKLIHAAIRKRIDEATYLEDETISEVNETNSAMKFDSSFNGLLYIGARTNDSAISEMYIGEFNVSERITLSEPAKPTPTPTPTWLPCPCPDP
jgi:uncharacterized repeat protein (TIGR01451 family)